MKLHNNGAVAYRISFNVHNCRFHFPKYLPFIFNCFKTLNPVFCRKWLDNKNQWETRIYFYALGQEKLFLKVIWSMNLIMKLEFFMSPLISAHCIIWGKISNGNKWQIFWFIFRSWSQRRNWSLICLNSDKRNCYQRFRQ